MAPPLETNVPLAQSLLWRRQRDFYAQRGLKAWSEDQVPAYITNNPFIAEIYAGIAFGFLCDCMASSRAGAWPPSPENPLRILEFGAGTGKFAYLFLRSLTSLLRAENIASETVRYCMTDCTESLVQTWKNNSYLAEFVASRVLEFELLQAGEETLSRFLARNDHSTSGAPLVVIANYVFDSLPQDAFIVKDGQLFEALVTTQAKTDAGTEAPPETLSSLQLSYENVVVAQGRYPDPAWNSILEQYRARLAAATVPFPTQALNTLQQIGKLTDGRMLVLAADKGFAYEDQLQLSQGPPALEFHSANCFSQMVNLDAIGKYFEMTGGRALLPDKHFSGLNICAFLQGPRDESFPETTAAYWQVQGAFGPDDLFTLMAWLNAHMEEMSVPQILSALRLTRWDTTALMRLFPVLARQLRNVTWERSDLRDTVLRVWANLFPITQGDNTLAFHCGVILLELRFFEDAAGMFRASQKMLGPSASTSYNLGLCALGLDRKHEALAFMVEACNLDPQFEPARKTRRKLEAEPQR